MVLTHFHTYGEFVYTLPTHYPSIQQSTLVLANIGRTLSELEGQLLFAGNVVLDVWELIDHADGRILNYSYEIYQAGEKMSWYDPFEHPHILELASTHPHHKHIHPDIKHHRVPAPGISFEQPNLPLLIQEIEHMLLDTIPSNS